MALVLEGLSVIVGVKAGSNLCFDFWLWLNFFVSTCMKDWAFMFPVHSVFSRHKRALLVL